VHAVYVSREISLLLLFSSQIHFVGSTDKDKTHGFCVVLLFTYFLWINKQKKN